MTDKRQKRIPGGGWKAIRYTLDKALEVGPLKLWQRMRSANACKTCAVGMGGQLGGMVNEAGHFPEVCKKSLQAQVADMQGALPMDYFQNHDMSSLMELTPKQAEDAGRITYPIVFEAGSSHWQAISWESALNHISQALTRTNPKRAAFYSSGRSSNEAGFLLQSFARIYGTNNVMNCSYYCHQASGVGLKMTFGSSTATVNLNDIGKADLCLLLGANPASNHPRLMTQLKDLRRRGGHVIVINPIKESGLEKFHVPSDLISLFFGTEIASLYVQPYAGGDLALLTGVLKALSASNNVDRLFLAEHAIGWQEVLSDAEATSWQEITEKSGVEKAQIEEIAKLIAASKAVIFAWAMGLTHQRWGVDNVLALSNLALVTGNVGKEGSGMLPIRGHSNVQGIGSMGVAPALQDTVRQSLEKLYGKHMPAEEGYDTHSMIEAARKGEIDALLCLGGNLWGSNPDLQRAGRAMNQIETVVYLSTKLNPGHFHGIGKTTVILPVLARDEEPQSTTQESMFNFVRLSLGGKPNVQGQMRSESSVICDLANRVLGSDPVDWQRLQSHQQVRKLIAEAIPGWQPIGDIDNSNKEFTIAGRVFHTPVFATADGRARMHRTALPAWPEDALRLITLRSEGQFNTVVYEEHDLYRQVPHRYCVLVGGEDATKLKIAHGERVRVIGEAGGMDNIEVILGEIRSGCVAMYFPEGNVLLKGNIDPRSKTPAFKCAPVWIEKMTAAVGKPSDFPEFRRQLRGD